MPDHIELSIVIPALNEENTIGICISKASKALKKLNINGEVIIADNGSTDKTADIAKRLGARVELVAKKGYGNALVGGFRAAKGDYLIMGDADDSYNFEELAPYYNKLKDGYDLVMGNRFKGKIEEGAMPFLHRYLGTPVLTWLVNLFFKARIGDTNCGMRGITKKAFEKLHLKASGMEFATEMIVKASILKLKISEVPCNLYRDKRVRKPHLRTWEDGWRNLRFMLLLASTWTFLVPGLISAAAGLLGMLVLFARDIISPNSLQFINQKHMLSFMLLFLTGCQVIQLGLIAKAFSFSKRFDRRSKTIKFLNKHFTLEKGIATGLLLILASALVFLFLPVSLAVSYLPRLPDLVRLDLAIFAISAFLLGVQFLFVSFVLSLFYLKVK